MRKHGAWVDAAAEPVAAPQGTLRIRSEELAPGARVSSIYRAASGNIADRRTGGAPVETGHCGNTPARRLPSARAVTAV
jgi:hypothetical protein